MLLSDDGGRTWRLGGRTPQDRVNECEAVELAGGRLMLNMRNYDRSARVRQISFSDDGGESWGPLQSDATLIEPICQASIRRVSWSGGPEGVIAFSNPASTNHRVNLTVRLSRDGGRTWPAARTFHAGPSAYSCLVALSEAQLGCLYECGEAHPYERIEFARSSVAWVEGGSGGETNAADSPVVAKEFIFETAPFRSCHASTIAETRDEGLVAAWFGGTREGADDVGIWVARREGGRWTEPAQAADGAQADGTRHPCWNPVLFQPAGGPLMLFYKVGPSVARWWGMVRSSEDGGRTWGPARRLPPGILGPVKNKPVQLRDGTIVAGSGTEHDGWRVHFERSSDGGWTWEATAPVNDGREFEAIQPTLLLPGGDRVLALGRTRQGRIFRIESPDRGRTWGPMTLAELPNPSSGLDGLTLRDGRHLLVYNHTGRGRSPLNVAVSFDGVKWRPALVLEDEAFSYPALIQGTDGRVHVTYTWKRRRIRDVALDPVRISRSATHDAARGPGATPIPGTGGAP